MRLVIDITDPEMACRVLHAAETRSGGDLAKYARDQAVGIAELDWWAKHHPDVAYPGFGNPASGDVPSACTPGGMDTFTRVAP